VALRREPGIAFELAGGAADVPADERNLAHRAARGFLERAKAAGGARVALEKRVPSGAGLGGGSSDAGAVLRALAELLPGALAEAELRTLALSLGADVPFFLAPRPTRVSGIGEVLAPADAVPALPVIVAHPGISLATAEVYRSFAAAGGGLTPAATAPTLRALPPRSGAAAGPWEEQVRNDLEPAATRLCPLIASLRAALRAAGAVAVGMSGSGPAVYGVFEDEERRDHGLGRLSLAPPARAFATATLASP
jgi:4-diphosphocytidyl-2-C-methyl-D-erythritol kinase